LKNDILKINVYFFPKTEIFAISDMLYNFFYETHSFRVVSVHMTFKVRYPVYYKNFCILSVIDLYYYYASLL